MDLGRRVAWDMPLPVLSATGACIICRLFAFELRRLV
jgi:hypothetical protein